MGRCAGIIRIISPSWASWFTFVPLAFHEGGTNVGWLYELSSVRPSTPRYIPMPMMNRPMEPIERTRLKTAK